MPGPILFNVFVNDLLRIDSRIVAFADDRVLLVNGKTWYETESKANKLVREVGHWFDNNLLTVKLQQVIIYRILYG